MITKNTLLRVAGALVVSAVLGSMPALADDDNRGKRVQCMVYSAFMWIGEVDQTEFDLLLTVNGEGFAKKGRTPVVKIAGKVLSPERILESADTSITINLQDYGVLREVVGDKLPQRTDPSLAVGFTIEIEPTRKRRTHCLPFAFSGVVQKPPPINPDERTLPLLKGVFFRNENRCINSGGKWETHYCYGSGGAFEDQEKICTCPNT